MRRGFGSTWPHVLVPEVGAMPPAIDPLVGGFAERVLHVALRTSFERQPGLEAALRSIASEYSELDWAEAGDARVAQLLARAAEIRPTLVWMQIQTGDVFRGHDIVALRALCDPRVVIVNWDGDQHFAPHDPERRWFAELGRVCDTSLVVNTQHPHEYARMGVRHPGYLQIGTDSRWAPAPAARNVPAVVLLAGKYPTHTAYAPRRDLVAKLSKRGPRHFGVYGGGWPKPCGHPMLRQEEEAPIYAGAEAAISMSIRADLPRYTSDRLLRALSAGAVVLVQAFPDMEGLGLVDGVNCLAWTTMEGLEATIAAVRATPDVYQHLRGAASRLAAEYHTWDARMPELLAIVEAVRGVRG